MEQPKMERYLGKMLDGRYEVMETIGRGGMAWVYKAHDHLLNRDVAIKILRDDMAADSDFRLHFKKEAQAVAKLSHANIVAIYDVSRVPNLDYIVMELIEGITLKQYMKTKGRLSFRECAHFAAQIAKALSHAHEKGIIHRDIKPQNIMIGLDGRIKVADFGIAYLETALGENRETALGSVHYISPEQAKGLPADARSDIYSLGVVLYEMLCGQLPFSGADLNEITKKHINGTPTPLHSLKSDIPPELETIVTRAMNTDIQQRYQSADEMLRDLDAYLAAHPGQENVEAPVRTDSDFTAGLEPISRSGEMRREAYLRRHRRSAKVSLLTGTLLLLVFAGALAWFLFDSERGLGLRDWFMDPVKISIPDFEGLNFQEVINSEDLRKIYNFEVNSVVNPDVEAGKIISQEPEGGKSRTRDSDGIDIVLTVSAGAQMVPVPDVLNMKYTDAVSELQRSGFRVDPTFTVDDTITADYVISTAPEAGDKIPVGATVYVTISLGPNIVTLQMPELVGLTESAARQRIEAANLAFGTVTYVESDKPIGTVIWQSVPAFSTVSEHYKVYLQVSSGPKETPAPTPEPTPEPTEAPPENSSVPYYNEVGG